MGARKTISNEEFVRAWINPANETVAEVAAFLLITVQTTYQRSKALKALGVNLPAKAKRKSLTPDQLEVAQLNNMIKRASKKEVV